MAGTTGFEPATSDVTGRRSNQTELRPRDVTNNMMLAWRRLWRQIAVGIPLASLVGSRWLNC